MWIAPTNNDVQVGRWVGVGRIIDDDPPSGHGIAIGDAAVVEGDRGARTLRFTVSRSSRKAESIPLTFTTHSGTAVGGSDYTTKTGSVTIESNQTSAVVRIPLHGDARAEGDESFTVEIASAGGMPIYRAVGTGRS